MKFFYLPVEKYESRWSEYVSGADGMFMHKLKLSDWPSLPWEIIVPHNNTLKIKSGVVLDTGQRAEWGFYQIRALLDLIEQKQITDEDVIYIEDFWLPGMEMLPYACQLAGIKPKVWAFCHANSFDTADFTYQMLPWIRHFEQGWAQWLTGIFVAHEALKTLIVVSNVCSAEKIYVVGTVMARQVLLDCFYRGISDIGEARREKTVLFTSRLDQEKRPDLFLQLAKQYRINFVDHLDDVRFEILSGRDFQLDFLQQALDCDVVCSKVTKREYFERLCRSAVMVNTAVQDFVSYGLGDALAYGCQPLMPDWLTFPDVLQHDSKYLYLNQNMEDAAIKLWMLIEGRPLMYRAGDPTPDLYKRFFQTYESSVDRMLNVML